MKKVLGLMLVLLMSGVVNGFAEDAAVPAMDPAKAEMMAKMQQYGTPGEGHRRLDALVGQWNYTAKWQMKPDSPAETMQGAEEAKWILDGRFLEQNTQGMNQGMPFTGLGITGYNNLTGEYQSVWLDNMGTGMMVSNGQFDSGTNAITESGTFSCPITGQKNMPFRSVWKIADNDHHTYEMYTKDEGGNEFKSMEITYERVATV